MVSSSLTLQATLLVPISGPTGSVADRHGLQGWQKTACESHL